MEELKRCAVVTGGNKGIGFAICKQLASNGVVVILTARDKNKGLEALDKLKTSEPLSHQNLIFHQLDVKDPSSIASLAEFVKTHFGKLDILVNNAATSGAFLDLEAIRASAYKNQGVADDKTRTEIVQNYKFDWTALTQTYELAQDCLETNYYGVKNVTEALSPLLHLSSSARIVNMSSEAGKLERIRNEWAKGALSEVEELSEGKVDGVINEFLKDFKEGNREGKGWPIHISAYAVSKAALNAYTRILAKKFPAFRVNCVHPGFVKTDATFNMGELTPEEGAEGPVKLALLPQDGPSGLYFYRSEASSF